MPKVSITASSNSKEAPVSAEFVLSLTQSEQAVDLYRSKNDLVKFLLSKLQEKSSKHKFLIQITNIGSSTEFDATLSISSSFGAVWDDERDGYVNVKVDNVSLPVDDGKEEDTTTDKASSDNIANSILITLYWISVD